MRWLLVPALIALVASACGGPKRAAIVVSGERGQTESSELAVAEVVARHLLVNLPPGEDVYVSFGESWTDPVDPPEGFLGRFGDIAATFAPVSAYREDENRNTTPLLLVVHLERFVGETVAEVTAVRFRYGVGSADGFAATVTYHEGTWRVSEKRRSWAR
jgi:hypothetical protein